MKTITYLRRVTSPSSLSSPPSRVFSVKVRNRYINQQKSFTLNTVCYEKEIRMLLLRLDNPNSGHNNVSGGKIGKKDH